MFSMMGGMTQQLHQQARQLEAEAQQKEEEELNRVLRESEAEYLNYQGAVPDEAIIIEDDEGEVTSTSSQTTTTTTTTTATTGAANQIEIADDEEDEDDAALELALALSQESSQPQGEAKDGGDDVQIIPSATPAPTIFTSTFTSISSPGSGVTSYHSSTFPPSALPPSALAGGAAPFFPLGPSFSPLGTFASPSLSPSSSLSSSPSHSSPAPAVLSAEEVARREVIREQDAEYERALAAEVERQKTEKAISAAKSKRQEELTAVSATVFPPEPAVSASTCVIAVRLPDASRITRNWDLDTPLSDVVRWTSAGLIAAGQNFLPSEITLRTNLPARRLTKLTKTLRELDLTGRILLIVELDNE